MESTWDKNNNIDADDEDNIEYQALSAAYPMEPILLVDNCSDYAIAHFNGKLQPARKLDEVFFEPIIMKNMGRLRFTHVLRLQSYAWPHLRKGHGHGALIFGSPGSGRTMSYVPPLCEAVCSALVERSRQLAEVKSCKLQGPAALVLAADLRRVAQIAGMCSALLRNVGHVEQDFSMVLTVPSAHSPEFFLRMLNGVGCLVATPAQFAWIMDYAAGQLLKFPQLQFVAIDDMDLMDVQQLQQAQQQLLQIVGSTVDKRPQLVMTSQFYERSMLQRLGSFNRQPLVLFGDYLEAAVYGGVRLQVRLLKREAKLEQVLHELQLRPPGDLRTVVYCNSDKDIAELEQGLRRAGYSCLAYYQSAGVGVRENVQRWMADSRGAVFVCTDNCPELSISHAHTLIHYSLSANWTQFKMRHRALSDNLANRLADAPASAALQSLVLLDDSNNRQLPRLVEFLQRHRCTPLDEGLLALTQSLRDAMEQDKSNEPALCSQLVGHGSCGDAGCRERHRLVEYDRLPAAGVPVGGDVKVQVLEVHSPVHYSVRLLERLPAGGLCWQKAPASVLALRLQQHFLKREHCLRLWPPQARQICAYLSSRGYERVRILHVPRIELLNEARSDLDVQVQALDTGTRIFMAKSGQLYECPALLRDEPPLALDLRLLGLVPGTGERTWHRHDADLCRQWLASVREQHFLQASIVFALSHTLFVSNLKAMVYAQACKMHVARLDLRHNLRQHGVARPCEQAKSRVLAFFAAHIKQPYRRQVIRAEEVPKLVPTMNRIQRLGEVVRLMFRERKSRTPMEEQQQQLVKVETKPTASLKGANPAAAQPAATVTSEDSCEALFKCLEECMRLDSNDCMVETVSGLLQAEPTAVVTQKKGEMAASDSVPESHQSTSAPNLSRPTLPPGCAHPDVEYYQTLATLELQVLLPEANQRYVVMLCEDHAAIHFSTLQQQPELCFTLDVPGYDALRHHRQGRRIYISLRKSWVQPYPLAFQRYKFMRPLHDKFDELEAKRKKRIKRFESFLLQQGFITGKTRTLPSEADEYSESSDDEWEEATVERAVNKAQHDCD